MRALKRVSASSGPCTKQASNALGVRKLELGDKGGRIVFKAQPNVDPATIIKLIQAQPRVYSLDGQDKLRVKMELPGAAERLGTAMSLVTALAQSAR